MVFMMSAGCISKPTGLGETMKGTPAMIAGNSIKTSPQFEITLLICPSKPGKPTVGETDVVSTCSECHRGNHDGRLQVLTVKKRAPRTRGIHHTLVPEVEFTTLVIFSRFDVLKAFESSRFPYASCFRNFLPATSHEPKSRNNIRIY